MDNNPTSKSAKDRLIRRKEVRLRCFCFRNIQMVSVFPTTWCFLLLLLFSLFFFLFFFDCLFVCLWSTNHSLGFQKRTSLQSEFNFKSEEKRVTFGLPQCSNFILLLCRTRNFLPWVVPPFYEARRASKKEVAPRAPRGTLKSIFFLIF